MLDMTVQMLLLYKITPNVSLEFLTGNKIRCLMVLHIKGLGLCGLCPHDLAKHISLYKHDMRKSDLLRAVMAIHAHSANRIMSYLCHF